MVTIHAANCLPNHIGVTWDKTKRVGTLMISLIQRVSKASVSVDNQVIGCIDRGLLALVAIEPADTDRQVTRLLDRLLGYRVFADSGGHMNRSLQDVAGGLLLVPQFTLAADTRKGMRPSFATAAPPEQGKRYFQQLVQQAGARYDRVASGRFGADMQVALNNDGPVTFWLEAR